MKERTAENVTTGQLQRVISLNTNKPNMKERSSHAECDHQATSKDSLTKHQRAIHEGKKYPCRECNHQATSNGNLTWHPQVIHKGKKFSCRGCDYQATSKGILTQRQQAIHEGKKYPCGECEY